MGRTRQGQRVAVAGGKVPCDTCAFKDPECWVADQAIGRKMLSCLQTGDVFFCHHGMALGGPEGKTYQPPLDGRGEADRRQMEGCGGFLRVAERWRGLSRGGQARAILRLQRQMLARYLASGACDEAFEGCTVEDLQSAVNLMASMQQGEACDEG